MSSVKKTGCRGCVRICYHCANTGDATPMCSVCYQFIETKCEDHAWPSCEEHKDKGCGECEANRNFCSKYGGVWC